MPKVLSVAITHEAMDETIFLLISEKNTFLLIDKKDRHPHQHCPEVCNYLMVNRGNAINAAFLIDSITRFERMQRHSTKELSNKQTAHQASH